MSVSRMPKTLKKKWVKALRSGHYRQGKGFLQQIGRNEVQNCCLGVLCRISGLKGRNIGTWWVFDGESGSLTHKLSERFGLAPMDEAHLITLNDKADSSFEEIATYIERNVRDV